MDGQLLQDICLFGVKVESHLCKPFEAPGTADAISDEHSCHVTLVDQLSDLGRGGEGRGGEGRGGEGRGGEGRGGEGRGGEGRGGEGRGGEGRGGEGRGGEERRGGKDGNKLKENSCCAGN